jgi:hypothetical protein
MMLHLIVMLRESRSIQQFFAICSASAGLPAFARNDNAYTLLG